MSASSSSPGSLNNNSDMQTPSASAANTLPSNSKAEQEQTSVAMSKQPQFRSTSLEYHDAEGNATLFGGFKFEDEDEDVKDSAFQEAVDLAVKKALAPIPSERKGTRKTRKVMGEGPSRKVRERIQNRNTKEYAEWKEAKEKAKALAKVSKVKDEGDPDAPEVPKKKPRSKRGAARKKVKLNDDIKEEDDEAEKLEFDSLEVETGWDAVEVTVKKEEGSEDLAVNPAGKGIKDEDDDKVIVKKEELDSEELKVKTEMDTDDATTETKPKIEWNSEDLAVKAEKGGGDESTETKAKIESDSESLAVKPAGKETKDEDDDEESNSESEVEVPRRGSGMMTRGWGRWGKKRAALWEPNPEQSSYD